MSYTIEILTTDENIIPAIKSAIEPLNRIQNEIRYEIANDRLIKKTGLFNRAAYIDDEVCEWFEQFRASEKGNLPYLVLILTGTLNVNHYGFHTASTGAEKEAAFTVNGHHQFVMDKVRFIKYYLVRYALSFIAPEIKNHPSKGCMFDSKVFKPDIKLSLDTGNICPECAKLLAPHLNEETKPALDKLLAHISNQHPYALVLKGGGIKGLALVGALIELEKYYSFNTFAGTSAGAIAAVLLAAGYKPSELKDVLYQTNFKEFIEGGLLNWVYNLVGKGGAIPGDVFTSWLQELLREKMPDNITEIEMKDLSQRAIVYASRRNEGVVRFDSRGDRKETYAAMAVRYSMSIPGAFVPKRLDDEHVFDGGLGNNFPLRTFINDNKNDLFFGLYLNAGKKKKKTIAGELYDIGTDADERQVVKNNKDKVVLIDTYPVSTLQFGINDRRKDFLLQAGKLGALDFLQKYNPESGVSESDVNELRESVNKQRNQIKYTR